MQVPSSCSSQTCGPLLHLYGCCWGQFLGKRVTWICFPKVQRLGHARKGASKFSFLNLSLQTARAHHVIVVGAPIP